ncbi:er-retrevial receptor ter1p [Cyclospora cayetanensis]|uniref:Er-retrevial receptor ter1p n=1 Tax=Cyclospora cayetanensis TaxID=88456 RepID=A0A1D3CY11_9EIME|nr:er-retrevial receptor ter1p [Cyclospora cayetanensis]
MDIWLFILGYLIHFVASCILTYKVFQQRTIYGLSFDTQLCFLASTVSRCIWSLDTRLVETWLAYLELGLSTFMSILLTYLMWSFRYTHTKQMILPLRAYVLIPVAGCPPILPLPILSPSPPRTLYSLLREPLGEHFVGLFLADLLHSVLAADYFVMWCRKLRHGGTLIYKGRV